MNSFCVLMLFGAGLLCNGGESSHTTTVVCPPVREWTPAFQKKAGAELRALPQGSLVGAIVVDAIGDRARAKACKDKAKAK